MIWLSLLAALAAVVTPLMVPLFAQAGGSTEGERWIAPISTSIVNLAATIIAWLTARDRLKYDSSHAIKDSKIADQEKDIRHHEEELTRLRKRVNRLALNLMAAQQDKPLPFPLDLGFSTDEDPSPPQT